MGRAKQTPKRRQVVTRTVVADKKAQKNHQKMDVLSAAAAAAASIPIKAAGDAYQTAIAAPDVRGARTRFYKVIRPSSDGHVDHYLENKEGLRFSASVKDIELIGGVDTEREVTHTEMIEQLDRVVGFFHVRFVKVDDGTIRSMYAHVVQRALGGVLKLRDLELTNSELRSCHMDRVVSLITKGKQFKLGPAAFAKLVKK